MCLFSSLSDQGQDAVENEILIAEGLRGGGEFGQIETTGREN
jgi:hypothetical protein